MADYRAGYEGTLASVRSAPIPLSEEGKAYIQYWIGRLEFALGYLDTITAVKKAATAEQLAKDARAIGDSQRFLKSSRIASEEARMTHPRLFGLSLIFKDLLKACIQALRNGLSPPGSF